MLMHQPSSFKFWMKPAWDDILNNKTLITWNMIIQKHSRFHQSFKQSALAWSTVCPFDHKLEWATPTRSSSSPSTFRRQYWRKCFKTPSICMSQLGACFPNLRKDPITFWSWEPNQVTGHVENYDVMSNYDPQLFLFIFAKVLSKAH